MFSQESRYRLFRLLHSLQFERITFATLTYPAEFPTESKVYKAHLKEYRRRFESKFGTVRAVWRLEFQKRGAPHYHLLYLDAPFIPVTEWCELWSNVIHTDDPNHRKIGVDVRLITTGKEAPLIAAYVGKYVGKEDMRNGEDVAEKPGRWWGKWNIEEIAPREFKLAPGEAEYIFACAFPNRGDNNSWCPSDPRAYTVFGSSMGTDKFSKWITARHMEYLEFTGRRKP